MRTSALWYKELNSAKTLILFLRNSNQRTQLSHAIHTQTSDFQKCKIINLYIFLNHKFVVICNSNRKLRQSPYSTSDIMVSTRNFLGLDRKGWGRSQKIKGPFWLLWAFMFFLNEWPSFEKLKLKKGHRGTSAASGFHEEILFLCTSAWQDYYLLPSLWDWPWKQHFLAQLQMGAVTVRLQNGTLDSLGCAVGIKSPWRLLSASEEDGEGQVLAAGPQMSTIGNRKKQQVI